MTNVFKTQEKKSLKRQLFGIAVEALEQDGWKVERVPGSGKSSVRRITKGRVTKVVSIRTTQDAHIAFPRIGDDTAWRTLDEVDAVVPVSVDDKSNPRYAKVHLIDGDEMRRRFNRAYEARKNAGHALPVGRGVWLALYIPESQTPASLVGAGFGLKFPPIATVPLSEEMIAEISGHDAEMDEEDEQPVSSGDEPALTIAEAKIRLAKAFGVQPDNVKIIIEG